MNTNSLRPHVLLAHRSRKINEILQPLLQNLGCEITLLSSESSGAGLVRKRTCDMVVVNTTVLQTNSDLCTALESRRDRVAVLLLLDDNETEPPIQPSAMVDTLQTNCPPAQIRAAAERLLRLTRLEPELLRLRQNVAMSYGFDNIVGIAKPMRQLKNSLRRVAPTDIAILLLGPAGAGKELIARTLHHHSRRRSGPFISIDFSALPDSVIEQSLFEGMPPSESPLLRQADGGTLFLDAVDAASPAIQGRLVDFLRTMTLTATGPEKTRIDLRIIAATDRDLSSLVDKGRFDRTLHSAISQIPFEVPALTDRREDIEVLCEYFLHRLAAENGRPAYQISREAVEKLQRHNWPGNVRELENCLRRAAALCRHDTLEPRDVTFVGGENGQAGSTRNDNDQAGGRRLDDSQREIIVRALNENDWNYTRTAQELGIGRTTLWRKVKKYRLHEEKDRAAVQE